MSLSQNRQLLAVCRENGSIEIWLPKSWTQILVLPGNKNCIARRVHWIEKENSCQVDLQGRNPLVDRYGESLRLVTSGLNGLLVEWDLALGQIKSKLMMNSQVWDSKVSEKYLYLAMMDNSIQIAKVRKDRIDFVRTLQKGDSKCLSIGLS